MILEPVEDSEASSTDPSPALEAKPSEAGSSASGDEVEGVEEAADVIPFEDASQTLASEIGSDEEEAEDSEREDADSEEEDPSECTPSSQV